MRQITTASLPAARPGSQACLPLHPVHAAAHLAVVHEVVNEAVLLPVDARDLQHRRRGRGFHSRNNITQPQLDAAGPPARALSIEVQPMPSTAQPGVHALHQTAAAHLPGGLVAPLARGVLVHCILHLLFKVLHHLLNEFPTLWGLLALQAAARRGKAEGSDSKRWRGRQRQSVGLASHLPAMPGALRKPILWRDSIGARANGEPRHRHWRQSGGRGATSSRSGTLTAV